MLKTNIKVLRIPQANIYITMKMVQDIANGVDILFNIPLLKFQPCKMAKGDPWRPMMLFTMHVLRLDYYYIFFFS